MEFTMRSIGVVRNERTEAIDDDWDRINSRIELDTSILGPEATDGLRSFSHVEVLFVFHMVDESKVETGARHPRNNPEWPLVGILAQRPKARPNRIGSTVCELMAVRPNGVIEVRGLDAIDGTPVLDIKPYFAEMGPRGDVFQPDWSNELMANYWVDSAAVNGDGPVDAGRLPATVAEQWLAEVQRSPSDVGSLDLIVARPAVDQRNILSAGRLDLVEGLIGDNWLERGSRSRPDGSANPDAQLNVMNIRAARLVAGADEEAIAQAGDQLFVDFDLAPSNVPPGTRLAIGSAVIEVTASPHTGCAKFTRRFGLAAHRWINGIDGRANQLRGICARVVVAGEVRQGDSIHKLTAP
jgi:tRNA-Thr(GGU) m(6)t(6)A37 methyltransferase TsaA